jgi:hypothetical protein
MNAMSVLVRRLELVSLTQNSHSHARSSVRRQRCEAVQRGVEWIATWTGWQASLQQHLQIINTSITNYLLMFFTIPY